MLTTARSTLRAVLRSSACAYPKSLARNRPNHDMVRVVS
jgi:hypothetical protein